MSVHEKMGPDDEALVEAAFGPSASERVPAPVGARLADVRPEEAKAALVGGTAPSPSPWRFILQERYGMRLADSEGMMDAVVENLRVILADPEIRGIPRDHLTLLVTEVSRSKARIAAARDGLQMRIRPS